MATAASLIRMSMQDLGVLGAGESGAGEHLSDGLRRLQMMISAWALDALTVIQTERREFPIVSGKGTYSIGPGLDFDCERPVGPSSLVGAAFLLNAGQPGEVESPCAVLTDDMYQGVRVKRLPSTQMTSVFYRPGSLARTPVTAPTPPGGIPVGEILLWPIPIATYPLVLYIERTVPQFRDLTTDYPIPEGYLAALQYNLTVALAPMFQVEPPPEVVRQARLSLAGMKRTNYRMTDIPIDPMFTMQTPGSGYDIQTGSTRRG